MYSFQYKYYGKMKLLHTTLPRVIFNKKLTNSLRVQE